MDTANSDFNTLFYNLYDFHKDTGTDLSTLTVWDLFLELVEDSELRSTAMMVADLPILELLARGMSEKDVARAFGISLSSVKDVADLWNIKAPLKTLDIDPLLVYNDGIDFNRFSETYLDSSLQNYTNDELRKAYDAVVVYKGLDEFLKDMDNE